MKSWNEMKRYLIDNNIEHDYDNANEIIDINADKLSKEQMDEVFSWDGFTPDDVQVEMFDNVICVNLVGGAQEQPEQDEKEEDKMRNEQIKRMAAMMAEYNELQTKRNEIKEQIEELERKAREIKAEQQHKGDLLAKLGNITTNNSYYEYQCKVKTLLDSYKGQEITEEIKVKIKAEKDKIHDECFEIVYTPCKPRQWYMVEHSRYNNETKRYYLYIENRNFENRNIERYDTRDYSYDIVIQERPELKRYKWEIEASYPDRNKYRENITKTTKYKTLEELAKALPDVMAEVEQVYKEHYKELFELAPDIYDLETIKTEIELPFEVTSKKIVLVKKGEK